MGVRAGQVVGGLFLLMVTVPGKSGDDVHSILAFEEDPGGPEYGRLSHES